jgi:cell division protein FtsQ
MAIKRKISIRKILQVFLTLVVTSCCIIAMVSASKIENDKTVKSVAIHFKNDKKYHFIQEQEILDLAITNRQVDVAHTPISKLDIHTMERLIMANPWVAFAQVYIDNERVLHMYVTQRIPVVRMFQANSNSFYLDTTLSIMPLSDNYIYYTTVVTNVPELKNDSAGWALRKDIVSLVRYIQADSFWNSQISQVVADSDGTFELVPILGDHRILFGTATNIKEKFNNLFTFYKNVLNRIGWDKYQTLDIRFHNQVVASPSLPYTGPVDKAVTNMNWINSIVETEAANDAKDSVKAPMHTAPLAAVVKKLTVKKPVVAAKKPAVAKKDVKKQDKKKTADKEKKKPQANNKINKKTSPKYVYPANKSH